MKTLRRLTVGTGRHGRREPFLCRPRCEPLENRRMLAGSMLQLELSNDSPAMSLENQEQPVAEIARLVRGSSGAMIDSGAEGEAGQLPSREPILLLPGILGSMPQGHLASWLAFDDEAMQPDNLQLDPVKRTYDDLLASLVAAGYNDGSQPGMRTLWAAPYDWRLPVAPRDGTADGYVDTQQLDSTDTVWEFGIEYLDYWIAQARTEWEAWELDPTLFSVDVVAHSMGGLVARSYIQSDLYQVGEIDQLLMLGTPNHGAVDAYQIREWINDALDFAPDIAVDWVAAGLTGIGPVGALSGTALVAGAQVLNSPSVESYSPSITDLLPTFDFISTIWPHALVHGIEDNTLLADLNSSYDYTARGVDAMVLLGTGFETNYELYHPLGLDLSNLWAYDDLPAGSGDGTVLATSARLPGVADKALDQVGHLELAGADVRAQQEIFEFLGIPDPAGGYETGAFRSLAEGIADWTAEEFRVIFAGYDPVEFAVRHWSGLTPIARGDDYAARENEALVVGTTEGLLANDGDVAGRSLRIQLVHPPLYGKLVLSGDGGFAYSPNQAFNREDVFRYRVGDGRESSELATVTITIATEYPWYNGARARDVNADSYVSPIDALEVITTLNGEGSRELPAERLRPLAAPFYDVNRDGRVSPIDALIVINYLNSIGAVEAEGESVVASSPPALGEVPAEPVAGNAGDDVTTQRHDRAQQVPEEATPLTPRTGLPRAETLRETRLLRDFHRKWAGSDLEEILTEIPALWRMLDTA